MAYNRDNAVSYAKQYANNYNPNYVDYATYPGSSDCANFVSQCLYTGGIAMNDDWHYRTPGDPNPVVSTAWRGAQSLRRFVQSLAGAVILDDPTSLKRGDVIFTLESGTSAKSNREATHAVIVSRDVGSDGSIYVCAHDTDKNDEIRSRSGSTSDWNSLFVHINDNASYNLIAAPTNLIFDFCEDIVWTTVAVNLDAVIGNFAHKAGIAYMAAQFLIKASRLQILHLQRLTVDSGHQMIDILICCANNDVCLRDSVDLTPLPITSELQRSDVNKIIVK